MRQLNESYRLLFFSHFNLYFLLWRKTTRNISFMSAEKAVIQASRAVERHAFTEALECLMEVNPNDVLQCSPCVRDALLALRGLVLCLLGAHHEALQLMHRLVLGPLSEMMTEKEATEHPEGVERIKKFVLNYGAGGKGNEAIQKACGGKSGRVEVLKSATCVLTYCSPLPHVNGHSFFSNATLLKAIYAAEYEKLAPSGTSPAFVAAAENYFHECVRVEDYGKAQQIASLLSRHHSGSKKYRMWGIEALLGQLEGGDAADDSMRPLQLSMVTKMLDRFLATDVPHLSDDMLPPPLDEVHPTHPGTHPPSSFSEEEEGERRVSTPAMAWSYVQVLLEQHGLEGAGEWEAPVPTSMPATWKTMMDFIVSPRGALLGCPSRRLECLAETLQQMARLTETHASASHAPMVVYYLSLSNEVARELWARTPDNWTVFEIYRATMLELCKYTEVLESNVVKGELKVFGVGPRVWREGERLQLRKEEDSWIAPPGESVAFSASEASHSLEKALSLTKALQQAMIQQRGEKGVRRGPYLAELALLQDRLGAFPAGGEAREAAQRKLEEAVVAYAQRFCQVPCCFLDVSTFLTPFSATSIFLSGCEGFGALRALAEEGKLDEGWMRLVQEESPAMEKLSLAAHTRMILGLRCLLAAWGAGGSFSFPSLEHMRWSVECCFTCFHRSQHLSASLLRSEEGCTDGYLLCAANIAFYAWYGTHHHDQHSAQSSPSDVRASVDLLARVFAQLQWVPRGNNNPMLLLWRVGMASLLGVFDDAAVEQLKLSHIQLDTMSHVGWWAALSGLPLYGSGSPSSLSTREEMTRLGSEGGWLGEWTRTASWFYQQLPKDVGKARRSAVKRFSWRAVRSVASFESKQRRSLARLWNPVESTAIALVNAQTYKNVVEVLSIMRSSLYVSLEEFKWLQSTPCGLEDNTDWLLIQSLLLAPIRKEATNPPTLSEALSRVLIPMPSMEDRLRGQWGESLLYSLLFLCDVAHAGKQEEESKIAKLMKSKKSKARDTGNAGASEDVWKATVGPWRWMGWSSVVPENPLEMQLLPVLRPIAAVVGKLLRKGAHQDLNDDRYQSFSLERAGKGAVEGSTESVEALQAVLEGVLQECPLPSGWPHALEAFLMPSGVVLMSALRLCRVLTPLKAVLQQWSSCFAEFLVTVKDRLEGGEWNCHALGLCEDGEDTGLEKEAEGLRVVRRLQNEKNRRVLRLVEDLLVDARAMA